MVPSYLKTFFKDIPECSRTSESEDPLPYVNHLFFFLPTLCPSVSLRGLSSAFRGGGCNSSMLPFLPFSSFFFLSLPYSPNSLSSIRFVLFLHLFCLSRLLASPSTFPLVGCLFSLFPFVLLACSVFSLPYVFLPFNESHSCKRVFSLKVSNTISLYHPALHASIINEPLSHYYVVFFSLSLSLFCYSYMLIRANVCSH